MKFFLEKLVVKNWGPFLRESVLEFSLNENKNVTYIVGRNSTGKTCIFDAINWLLFDSFDTDSLKSVINKGVKGLRVYSINQHPEKNDQKKGKFRVLKNDL